MLCQCLTPTHDEVQTRLQCEVTVLHRTKLFLPTPPTF